LYRLVVVNQLKLSSHDPFDTKKFTDFPKAEWENQITETIKNRKERNENSKENRLYTWRVNYPH
jgi:hypothetical protein